jgi:hypothetical protein
VIVIQKFLGLVTNASPYALPPGAMVDQLNLQCLVPGQLTVRPGLQAVTFTSADVATQPILSAFRYQKGIGEHLVYQDATGKIFSSVRTGTA